MGTGSAQDGTLTVLPKIEYFLEDIRTSAHKLATDQNGKLTSNAIKAAKKDGDRQCPADLSPALHERIDAMAQHADREHLKHPAFFHSLLERAVAEKKHHQVVTDTAEAPTMDVLPELGSSSSDSSDAESDRSSTSTARAVA